MWFLKLWTLDCQYDYVLFENLKKCGKKTNDVTKLNSVANDNSIFYKNQMQIKFQTDNKETKDGFKIYLGCSGMHCNNLLIKCHYFLKNWRGAFLQYFSPAVLGLFYRNNKFYSKNVFFNTKRRCTFWVILYQN